MAVKPPGDYSLLGLINGDSYESGLASVIAERYRSPGLRGDAIPHRKMLRDLGVVAATSGGNLANATAVERVADAVRPAVVLERMGAERIEVSGVATLSLPRFVGGSGGWLAEGEASVSDAATISSVTASPHCAAARMGLTRKVMVQTRVDIEAAVLREVRAAVTAVLEAGFLAGIGSSNQPLGLINTPGIGSQSFAGAVPTLSELVAMVETYADADGDLSAARWLMHPSDLADLMTAQVDPDGGELIVEWSDGQHRIAGLPISTTRHMTEGKHLLLDPSAVKLVYFGAPQVVNDLYSAGKSLSGAAELVLFNFADAAVLRPAHIVLGSA
jgi:HK97 family phage major capsid protein